MQMSDENFTRFCKHVEVEARHHSIKCNSNAHTEEQTAERDQVIIGTSNNDIHEEALKKTHDLIILRSEGRRWKVEQEMVHKYQVINQQLSTN